MNNNVSYLYKTIIDDIKAKIGRGEYLPGARLESFAELQNKYGVGRNTVLRVIDELSELSLIGRHKGKGCFIKKSIVSDQVKTSSEILPIRKITLYIANEQPSLSWYGNSLVSAITADATKKGLDIKIEIHSGLTNENQLSFNVGPDEGIISLFKRPENHILLHQILSSHSFRCVLIDGVFPGAKSVLTDNNHGMVSLVKHLNKSGHRHLCFAGLFSPEACFFNVNERMLAFKRACETEEVEGCIHNGDTFESLLQVLKGKKPPTAILFPFDDSARNFIKFLDSERIKVPDDVSVCGFDDIPPGDNFLTTYRINPSALGKAAVELLLKENLLPNKLEYWRLVPGKLVVRKSVRSI